LRFARACALDDLGRTGEAVEAYLAVLKADQRHFGALTNLGSIAFERHQMTVAFLCFRDALAVDPNDVMAHLNIARYYSERAAYPLARAHYEFVLAARPDDLHTSVYANNGLARVAEAEGDPARAAVHRERAFAVPVFWEMPYRGSGDPLRVLVLTSPHGGDMVSNLFFDDRVVARMIAMPEAFAAGATLPPHDLLFNGVGEPDATRTTLECAVTVAAASSAPVINDPRAVLRTSRATMMQRLAGLDGVIAPRTTGYARADVSVERLLADGHTFPLLVRAAGFHGGEHFAFVASPADLASTLDGLPGDRLYAIAFVDARGEDGWVRKYRVAFIDGRCYPIHLALAKHWKVHYFSAAMSDHAEHRAEEQRFLDAMETVLGERGMRALAEIARTLALDYGGVDFGRAPNGDLIVFEANATMAVYPPSDDPRWDYRRASVDRAVAAVRTMIAQRATSRNPPDVDRLRTRYDSR
jgi:glutathione synthase/RimK-type ligase-like ATP-grasp enzyme